ncbi:HAMP domain-containing protein [Paenibacillus sp. LMG 31458]|uniref:HAMP domain-containing protein n=2 Tax=Paenibacillus TaxID=44249 RepID=A0ABX1Z9K3_9BACL|nr:MULTISPECIES: histidine kinase [Paenibacillus]NOU71392.1 HAMP domain-containing protein [Paenibacillus phytorum]NOU90047.1 HAMP domain-containing protein [Paenibacillus germinis]
MVIQWRKWRFSIFTKLVLAFLIVISPLYALGTRINEWGADIVKNEISKSLQSQVQFYRTLLENEIDRMVSLQREYVNDDDLLALSLTEDSMSTYQRIEAMKRFQRKLELMKQSSIYVERASAYIPLISRIVATDDLSGDLPQEELEKLKQSVLQSKSLIVQSNNKLFIREHYPNPLISSTRNPIFVLEQEISIPALKRYLQQLSGYDQGGAALMLPELTVVNTNNTEVPTLIRNKIEQQIALSEANLGSSGALKEQKAQTLSIRIEKESYLTVFAYLPKLEATLLVYVPESEVMGPLEKYRSYLWMISFVALIVILLFAYWIFRIIHRPLTKLVRAFHKVESGNMQIMLQHSSNDEFSYLYERFNFMVAYLNKLIYEVYEQKIHAQQSELKQLQSQINPHFLYNSFYLLYRMTKAHDFDNATQFTKYLGDYFQYITRSGSENAALEQEFNHVRAYAEIQSIRFSNRIQFIFDEIPEVCKQVIVPRLILQPIVENAYQHGFEGALSDRLLRISVELDHSMDGTELLLIHIEDNGKGLTEHELNQWKIRLLEQDNPEEVTGMLNVHRRLRLKYGTIAGIVLTPIEAGGLRVTIKLPIHIPPIKT